MFVKAFSSYMFVSHTFSIHFYSYIFALGPVACLMLDNKLLLICYSLPALTPPTRQGLGLQKVSDQWMAWPSGSLFFWHSFWNTVLHPFLPPKSLPNRSQNRQKIDIISEAMFCQCLSTLDPKRKPKHIRNSIQDQPHSKKCDFNFEWKNTYDFHFVHFAHRWHFL